MPAPSDLVPPPAEGGARAAAAVTDGDGRRAADPRPGLVLLVACLAQFMVVLDVAVVNVAIPDMTRALSLSASGQQWVIDAYTLTFGGLLLLGGRVSDMLGHRRMFLVGVVGFTVFSLVCGLSGDQQMITWARAAQGLGGAILAPTSLSLLTTAFTDLEERHRAIAAWAAVSAGGAAAGVLVGGILTSALSWRWVFFINVPVGAAIFAVTVLGIHLVRSTRRVHLDVAGAVLVTGSVGLVLYAVIGVQQRGWDSAATIWLLVAGVAALAVFTLVEARVARDPLLPLVLLRDRQRAVANSLFAIIGAVIFFLYFDVSLHLQRVDGASPLRAGLSFLPVAVATTVAAMNGQRLLALLGARRQLVLGLGAATIGFWWLSGIGVHAGYWTHEGLPMVLIGLGMGMSFVPATVAATTGVPPEHNGVASGVVNTSRQVGGALGLAAMATVAASVAGPSGSLASLAHGDQVALLVCAALTLVGALVSLSLSPLGRKSEEAPA